MSQLNDFFEAKDKADQERAFSIFMENARNAIRAVKAAIEEGDHAEALRLIDEALGEGADPAPLPGLRRPARRRRR